uniref:Bifunctional inhibitor/plant lipid transfer protein/seed storage helical domain-containing protein n=1 Tax=Kalanchoe fedtschenkoi TaxID=63787 RepID=A0A7N0TUZ6_KALFE
MNMVACLTYVSGGSSVTKPEGTCCAGLKTLLRTRAECLCQGLKSSSHLGIVLSVTKAATLPAACSLSSPSISNYGRNSTFQL